MKREKVGKKKIPVWKDHWKKDQRRGEKCRLQWRPCCISSQLPGPSALCLSHRPNPSLLCTTSLLSSVCFVKPYVFLGFCHGNFRPQGQRRGSLNDVVWFDGVSRLMDGRLLARCFYRVCPSTLSKILWPCALTLTV